MSHLYVSVNSVVQEEVGRGTNSTATEAAKNLPLKANVNGVLRAGAPDKYCSVV